MKEQVAEPFLNQTIVFVFKWTPALSQDKREHSFCQNEKLE